MNKYIKPSSLAFYLLIIILFFVIGAVLARVSGVAENQGLAGGAIILGYGLMAALGGIVLAFIVISRANIEKIKKANWIILLLVCAILAFLNFRYNIKEEVPEDSMPSKQPKTVTSPSANLTSSLTIQPFTEPIGLGLFTPNYYENNVFYFYSLQNQDKPLEDNPKLDSITFSRTEQGDFSIATAPPWLQPEHLKLDYGILYFKVIRIGKDYLLLEGNTTTKQTYFVSRWSGDIILWPEFILSTFMLEFPEEKPQPIRIKPLENASTILNPTNYLRAISIQDYWVEVEVLDEKWNPIDKGWIKWRDESGLLVQYSLLS